MPSEAPTPTPTLEQLGIKPNVPYLGPGGCFFSIASKEDGVDLFMLHSDGNHQVYPAGQVGTETLLKTLTTEVREGQAVITSLDACQNALAKALEREAARRGRFDRVAGAFGATPGR